MIEIEETDGVPEKIVAEIRQYFKDLPVAYERFLSKHNGAKIDADFPEEKAPDGLGSALPIMRLVRAENLTKIVQNHAGLSNRYIPIGDDGGGNYTCICVEDKMLYYYDHDWSEFHLLAKDFETWLNDLVAPQIS